MLRVLGRLCVASFWGIGSLNFNFAALQLINSVFFFNELPLAFIFSPFRDLSTWLQKKHSAYCPVLILHADNRKPPFFPQICNDILIFSRGYFKRITTISSQFKLPMCQGYLIISSRWKNAVCRLRIARVLLQAVVRDAILWWISRRWNHCV